MSECDGMVQKWARVFKDGRHNFQDKEITGRPSVTTDNWLQKVE